MARILTIVLLTLMLPAGAQIEAQDPARPERIPDDWIDLPESPFVAYLHNGKAVLLNRSKRGFYNVSVGCVFVDGPRVRIDHGLFAQNVSHGGYGPGTYVEDLLRMINIIDFYEKAAAVKRCPAGTQYAVTGAETRNGEAWSAQGTVSREELLGDHESNGVIFGTARDSFGGVIPGATVTATSTGQPKSVTTDWRGEYAIVGLDRGRYQVTGVLAGFRTVTCEAVDVAAAVAHCDFRLSTGGPPVPRSDPRYQALLAAESRWRAAGIKSYEYAVSVACFCGFDRTPFAIRVVDGVSAPIPGNDPWRNKAGEHYNSIEKLFAMVRSALDRGDEIVDVSYDTATGRPLVISLDMSRRGEDDDVFLSVSEFKIIKGDAFR
jgi:hypothetical protein